MSFNNSNKIKKGNAFSEGILINLQNENNIHDLSTYHIRTLTSCKTFEFSKRFFF